MAPPTSFCTGAGLRTAHHSPLAATGRDAGQDGYPQSVADYAAWSRALQPKRYKLVKNRRVGKQPEISLTSEVLTRRPAEGRELRRTTNRIPPRALTGAPPL